MLTADRKKCLPCTEKSPYRRVKKVLTADRKICLPSTEKTPYRMMVKSSYRAHKEEYDLLAARKVTLDATYQAEKK